MIGRTPSPETPLSVVTAWPRPDVCVVRLVGVLDMGTAPAARERLGQATARRPAALVLDLGGVEMIAAAGVSVVITAMRNEEGIRSRLYVVAPFDGVVRRVLRLTRVDTVLRLHRSVADALRAADAARST